MLWHQPNTVSVDPSCAARMCIQRISPLRWRACRAPAGQVDQYDTEYRVQTKSGEWRWIFERGRVSVRGESGEPLSLVGICLDIDKHKRL